MRPVWCFFLTSISILVEKLMHHFDCHIPQLNLVDLPEEANYPGVSRLLIPSV